MTNTDAPQLPKKPFAFAFHFIKQFKWTLLIMALFEAGQAACQILLPYAVRQLIDTVTVLESRLQDIDVFTDLRGPLMIFAGLSLGVLVFSRASGALLVYVGPAQRRMVRQSLYSYLQHHSHRYFTSNFSGSLANRVSEVSMGVNHSLWTVMFDFWPVLITFSVSLVLLFQTHMQLGVYLGIWITLYVLVSFLLAARCRYYARNFAEARSQVSGKIVDSVTNILNTKMFARLGFERKYLGRYLDLEVARARDTFWFMEKMRWFQFTAALILQLGMMWLAIGFWVQGAITVGSFAMVTSLSLLIINDARGLSRRFLEFFEYLGNISDGVNAMITDHEILDAPEAPLLKISQGVVEYKDVHFRYDKGKEVFQGLNVHIQAGERVGLVGFSGSGKSTFVNLITRLYDINSGQILIDGQDISKVRQDSLREAISMIPQEPMLFHRALLENIRYGRITASDQEVIRAAQLAHAHDFIKDLPEEYQSLVGERGVKLSGGQRQRIAIARAILKDAPILILDEATSALDSVTEKFIQRGLENLMQGKTVIAIAHRLSTISHLDRILVFKDGRIIEEGAHDKLLAADGHYAYLWNMQVGGFLPNSSDDPALVENGANV